MEPYHLSEEYYSGGSYDRPLEGVDSCFNLDAPKELLAQQGPKRVSGADAFPSNEKYKDRYKFFTYPSRPHREQLWAVNDTWNNSWRYVDALGNDRGECKFRDFLDAQKSGMLQVQKFGKYP